MTTPRPQVILVRHGRTALNAQSRLRGRLDVPLDSVGEVEAAALAMALDRIHPQRVLTSPLRRAVQTAEPIASRAGIPLEVDARLVDRDFGPWAGHLRSHVVDLFGSVDNAPGVEPAETVLARARAVLDEQSPARTGPVVLVTHDALVKALLTDLEWRPAAGGELEPGADVEPPTGSWAVLHLGAQGWVVDEVGVHVDPVSLQPAE
jgi:probable phosphoglycerate mutase